MIRDFIRHRVLRQPVQPPLPDKPSALIRVALADLRKVEKNPAYDVNMDLWHTPAVDATDTCSVCFAGAVMSQSLQKPIDISACPYDFDDADTEGKLLALNKFRKGRLAYGLDLMEVEAPTDFKKNWHVADYETHRERFHENMHEIANYLEDIGL